MSEPLFSQVCQRALLIGIRESKETVQDAESHLKELKGLMRSLGIPVVGSQIAPLRTANSRWLIGRGKMEEFAELIHSLKADLIVFDCDLSPAQQRNLERDWDIAVIDRQEVILDIFADRAYTREAVLQVSLARMKYSLPRLTRAWTHLSRQRGGARGTRGKGETQLESDRRVVLDKIANLKRELQKVRDQRNIRRKKRQERPVPSISLVGYTNAGKSSLLNTLSGADVPVADQLFATLDPTTRKIEQIGGRELLVTDTVGFIRKLPHDLVDAFHSTLEETIEADIILNVADASDNELEQHIKVTQNVLEDLGVKETPVILVLNKADRLAPDERKEIEIYFPDAIFVSARMKVGIETLIQRMGTTLDRERVNVTLSIPANRWDLRAKLHQEVVVIEESYKENEVLITACLGTREIGRYAEYISKK